MADWFQQNLGWMYWTTPSALVFVVLFGAIAGMAVWDRVSPGYARKGFLPMMTTRGDRFFVGVMVLVGIYLLWLAMVGAAHLWGPLALAAAVFAAILRWG